MHPSFDTSQELIIKRFGAGVKIMRPEKNQEESVTSLKNLFSLPFNIYFLNTLSIIQNMSEETARVCGFISRHDAIGNTARTVSKKASADFSIAHNNEVLMKKRMIIKDEHFLRLDDFDFNDIAIKFPLFNSEEKLIGIFGCSIIIDQSARCSLSQALTRLSETGLLSRVIEKEESISLNPYTMDVNQLQRQLSLKTKLSFSKREIDCLIYLMNGKTAAETANALHLSRRTIEHYRQILKEKLHCRTKSQLIDYIISIT